MDMVCANLNASTRLHLCPSVGGGVVWILRGRREACSKRLRCLLRRWDVSGRRVVYLRVMSCWKEAEERPRTYYDVRGSGRVVWLVHVFRCRPHPERAVIV